MSDTNPIITPGTTHYDEVAETFTKAFDAMVTSLPELQTSHPSTGNFVRGHLNVPNDFVAAAITAVEANPALQGMQAFDPAAARHALELLDAFTPLLKRVTAFRDALEYTLWATKATWAAKALQVYGVSKQLARDADAAVGSYPMSAHVEFLKQALGRRGGTAKPQTQNEPK